MTQDHYSTAIARYPRRGQWLAVVGEPQEEGRSGLGQSVNEALINPALNVDKQQLARVRRTSLRDTRLPPLIVHRREPPFD